MLTCSIYGSCRPEIKYLYPYHNFIFIIDYLNAMDFILKYTVRVILSYLSKSCLRNIKPTRIEASKSTSPPPLSSCNISNTIVSIFAMSDMYILLWVSHLFQLKLFLTRDFHRFTATTNLKRKYL